MNMKKTIIVRSCIGINKVFAKAELRPLEDKVQKGRFSDLEKNEILDSDSILTFSALKNTPTVTVACLKRP